MKPYTGIGARKTPTKVLKMMSGLATFLAAHDYVLRSGGAPGADTAFEEGCDRAGGEKEIYLPWKGFNKNKSDRFTMSLRAREIAEQFHPKWSALNDDGRLFMSRNSNQIFGDTGLGPRTQFIVCWTPNGAITGGTGQALRIASSYHIPVFNFGNMTPDKIESGILAMINK